MLTHMSNLKILEKKQSISTILNTLHSDWQASQYMEVKSRLKLITQIQKATSFAKTILSQLDDLYFRQNTWSLIYLASFFPLSLWESLPYIYIWLT